jgi:hypothetical protein
MTNKKTKRKKATKKKATKKKHAGGRTPLPDGQRKERVEVFIEGDKIKARGGMDAMKQHLYQQA